MELLAAIVIVLALGLSAGGISRRLSRSRYEPLPKPPASISRQYQEEPPKPKRYVTREP